MRKVLLERVDDERPLGELLGRATGGDTLARLNCFLQFSNAHLEMYTGEGFKEVKAITPAGRRHINVEYVRSNGEIGYREVPESYMFALRLEGD